MDLFSYGVDLDRRVRQDHPLAAIARNVNFSFVREEVKGKYGCNGQVGLDPDIVLKLMFLLYWDNVKSERELMKILPERLDYLWYLGYGLDDDFKQLGFVAYAANRIEEARGAGFANTATEGGADFIRIPAGELRNQLPFLLKPIGLLAANDLDAAAVMTSCIDVGIKMPEEVAILGADDSRTLCADC